jgi:cell division septum initiation protein DivIVA
MTSEIVSKLKEIDDINNEIKRFRAAIKKLQTRSITLQTQIQEYISAKNQPGFKYNNTIVTLDKKHKIQRKSKKQKNEDQIEALRKLGITNPNEVLLVLDKSGKGETVVNESIKIKTLKK